MPFILAVILLWLGLSCALDHPKLLGLCLTAIFALLAIGFATAAIMLVYVMLTCKV
jgi:hypothetical protein